jgi:predicted NBD/HSP70 family sugar kinase
MGAPGEQPLLTADSARLLSYLRDGHPRTRAELATLTGLARSTISLRLDGLMASGLVVQGGDSVSSGGRPAGFIAFEPDARILLAIDLGATHGVVALANLAGTIIATESVALRIADGPTAVLDWALAAADRLLAASGRPAADLVGVGVGLPGPVEHSTGMPTNPPIMPGWDRFDVPGYLGRRFAVPVLVDNDVNLLALGEHATAWREATDLLFVKVSTGIGAGIISGGRLQRGAQGSAGDLGHVRVPFTGDNPKHGEEDADLEALASAPAIARAVARQVALGNQSGAAGQGADQSEPAGRSTGQSAGQSAASETQELFESARSGNPVATEAIRQAGRDLGEVLATVVNILNPSVIVIGGSVARAGEHLVAGVREVVYGRSTPLSTRQLTIVESRAGENGGVLGAAIMVIQHVLDPQDDRATLR